MENGSAVSASAYVKELRFSLSCPKRSIMDAGTLGAVDQGLSTFALSGQIVLYNSATSRAIAARHYSGALSSLEWQMLDFAGNREHYWLPGIYFNGQGGAPSSGPRDQDVMITMPFTCIADSTISSMFQYSKIAA